MKFRDLKSLLALFVMFAAHSLSADTITHATVTYNGGPGESVLFTLSSSLSKGFGDIPGGIAGLCGQGSTCLAGEMRSANVNATSSTFSLNNAAINVTSNTFALPLLDLGETATLIVPVSWTAFYEGCLVDNNDYPMCLSSSKLVAAGSGYGTASLSFIGISVSGFGLAGDRLTSANWDLNAVPEPSTFLLFGSLVPVIFGKRTLGRRQPLLGSPKR